MMAGTLNCLEKVVVFMRIPTSYRQHLFRNRLSSKFSVPAHGDATVGRPHHGEHDGKGFIANGNLGEE